VPVTGTVVAVYTLGCLTGALCSTIIGNKLGRRKTLVIGALWASIGLILQASSFSLAQMVIGRIVSGFGVGGVNAIVPVWQAECSKPKSRGKSVVIIGIFIATGIATAAWVNFGLSHIAESAVSWRLPLAIPLIFTMWIVAFAFCFPESPRWLVQQGRIHQAKQVMSILQNIPIDSSTIQMEIASIEQACEAESHRKASFKLIFTTGPQRLLYRAALAILVNFFAQMTGANAISYYATTIFRESLDFPASQSSLLAAGVLTWKIFAASLAYFIVDRFGRKPLFMVSGFGMSLSMTCLAICVSFIKAAAAGKAAVFFLFLYMTFFPLGFLGANFLYATEIAPQGLRVHFSAIGTAVSRNLHILISPKLALLLTVIVQIDSLAFQFCHRRDHPYLLY
jgi:sugar porter (SP) family MFS transporter